MIFNWKDNIPKEELDIVIKILENDGVIIFPTDTVYGIACNCYSKKAISKIFEIKKRELSKPINVLTDSVDKINKIAYLNSKEKELIEKYMPGALTIILNKKDDLPEILTSNLKTVGVRIPNNEIALKILNNFPYPLATTSANESGKSDGLKIEDFANYFKDKVDVIIDGGITNIGQPSTIIRVENNEIKILREGSIKIRD